MKKNLISNKSGSRHESGASAVEYVCSLLIVLTSMVIIQGLSKSFSERLVSSGVFEVALSGDTLLNRGGGTEGGIEQIPEQRSRTDRRADGYNPAPE